MLVLKSLQIMEKSLTHHLLIMVATAEISPTAHLITSAEHEVSLIMQLYQLQTNHIRNTSEYQRNSFGNSFQRPL